MIDPELAELDRRLDALAAEDLASAPAWLEARVAAAAISALASRATSHADHGRSGPRSLPRRLWFTPARVAATIGLAGALLAAYAATGPGSTAPGSEQLAALAQDDLEVLLAVTATLDDPASDELSEIHFEAATLSDRVRGGLPMTELFDEGAL
ncbi:MAG: hypothetical protein ACOYN0_20185 [Phycisphaerales bacterium]